MENKITEFQFCSKVDVDVKGPLWYRVFKVIFLVTVIVSIGCLFLKFVMGDLRFSDVKPFIWFLIILGCCKGYIPRPSSQEETTAKVFFDEDKLCILYDGIGSAGKRGAYSEKTFITYAGIKEVDLSRNLNCFRIVGYARRERLYKDGQVVVEQNPDEDGETFIYVSYDDDQNQLKDMIQQKTGLTVKEMD